MFADRSDPTTTAAKVPPHVTAATDEHTHEWQPNGSVEVSRMAKSPCSTWDDEFWLDVIALAVCRCGAIKRDRIGTKGHYRRGDKLRNQR